MTLETRDGRRVAVEFGSTVYQVGDGNVIQCNVRGSSRDITERKKVDEALRRSEERFRLLLSSVQDYAIIMLDSDGRVVSWNEGAERIKGYRAEEIAGQHFSRFYPREDTERGKPDHTLKVAAAEGRFKDEGLRVRKDASTFWANVVITAVRDETGRLRGFSKVTRDITDRKRPEEKRFFNISLDMLCISKSHGYFKRLNPSFTKTLGWSMEGTADASIHPSLCIPTTATARSAKWRNRLPRVRWCFVSKTATNTKDGSWRWLSWRSVPEQGGLMYASARDVTDQRQAEADIEKLKAGLQERTSQLEAAYKELEAFSYSVSHDLRAPLRAIDGFSKAVLEDYGAQCRPKLTVTCNPCARERNRWAH